MDVEMKRHPGGHRDPASGGAAWMSACAGMTTALPA